MKLYFDDTFLGAIANVTTDDFWLIGDFKPTKSAGKFQELFEYLASEDKESMAVPVDEDIIFGPHWFIKDELGKKRSIIAPAVYPDGQITWQWM